MDSLDLPKPTTRTAPLPYHDVFEQAVDGMFLANEKFIYVDVNPSGHRMLGYAPGELIGGSILDVIRPEDIQLLTKNYEILRQGKPLLQEWLMRRKDGTLLEVEISLQKLRHGLILAQVRENAERKKTEARLRDSEARFRSYFELPLVGISITSLEKGWLEVNDRLCEMFGYTRAELMALTWAELTYPDDLDADVAQFNRVLKGEIEGYSMDKRFVKKNGTFFHTTLSVRCVRKPGGSVDYFVALIQDITERKLFEQQLLQSQKVESIGRLAGGVAHDFNNLLTSILGFSEFAMRSLSEDSPARPSIERVIEAAGRGATLTQQLLAFARKKIIRPEPVDLNRIIGQITPMLRRLIGENIELESFADPNLGIVMIDPGGIEQVIMNLAVNARDAMPKGGTLKLDTRNSVILALPAQRFQELPAGPCVSLTVSDTGVGMDPAVLARIFEPFFTTKATGQGTGLGLSMCHGIIKQAGGHIKVHSEPGKGSIFSVYLPRIQAQETKAHMAVRTPVNRGGTETILVVEDESLIREFACMALSHLGYRVLSASNGLEALQVVAQHESPPHLVLTDVIMPKMGGRELADKLKDIYPGLKTIFVSGYTEDAVTHSGVLEVGLNFIQKPYKLDTLAAAVRRNLDGK